MADTSESTPFLASNDYSDDTTALNDSENEIPKKTLSANSYFKRLIKISTICVMTASILGTIFLTASIITILVAPFPPGYTYSAQYALRELGICLFISFILSTLMIFLQLPILVNLLINLILTILALVFAGNVFGRGWPGDGWCYGYRYPTYPDTQCTRLRLATRILIGIGGGLGFLVGLFYLVLLLLRVIAISKTKFWKRNVMCPSNASGQYTFQITLGFLKKSSWNTDGNNGNARDESVSESVDGPLIDA